MNLAIAKMSEATPYQEWLNKLRAIREMVGRGSDKEGNAPKQSTAVKSVTVRIVRVKRGEQVTLSQQHY